MSFRKEKKQSLIGVNYSEYNSEQLQNLSSTVLENGMGISRVRHMYCAVHAVAGLHGARAHPMVGGA